MKVAALMAALATTLAVGISASGVQKGNGYDKAVMCYFGSWSVYRPGNGKFDVEDIDPFACTHLVYGFAGLDEYTYKIEALDPYNELFENWGRGAFQRFTGLKNQNPNLVTLLAIGGWNEGATKYSQMALTQERRATFIASTVDMVKEHGFDGLDLDWEYPGGRSDSPGAPEDKANFASLLREMRAVYDTEGLLMTAAVSAGYLTIDAAYDIPAMAETLDFIQIMTYDYHGYWDGPHLDKRTGHNSPLYALPSEEDPEDPWYGLNTDFSMKYWVAGGARKDQLLMGMGSYGRGYRLADPNDNGYHAPSTASCDAEPYTRTPGTKGYNEYCEFIYPEGWQFTRDPYLVAPFVSKGDQWFSFDDQEAIRIKSEYIVSEGYAGGMFWSIETDDFKNFCGGGKFGLIMAAQEVLNGGLQTPPPGWTEPPTDGGDGVTPATDMCDGESTGPFPMPNDCTKFYNCIATGDGWEVQVDSCMDGLVFNPENGVCDWPDNVDDSVCDNGGEATDAPQPTTTQPPATNPPPAPTTDGGDGGELELDCSVPGPAPFPDNCDMYYSCVGDTVVIGTCPSGLVFNPEGYCDWPENVCTEMCTQGC